MRMGNPELLTSAEEIRGAIRATLASEEFAVAVPYWGGNAFNAIGLDGDPCRSRAYSLQSSFWRLRSRRHPLPNE